MAEIVTALIFVEPAKNLRYHTVKTTTKSGQKKRQKM